jgi:hypothetical protein
MHLMWNLGMPETPCSQEATVLSFDRLSHLMAGPHLLPGDIQARSQTVAVSYELPHSIWSEIQTIPIALAETVVGHHVAVNSSMTDNSSEPRSLQISPKWLWEQSTFYSQSSSASYSNHIDMKLRVTSCVSLVDQKGVNRMTTVPNCYPAMGDMDNHILPTTLYLIAHIFLNLFRLCFSMIRGLEG